MFLCRKISSDALVYPLNNTQKNVDKLIGNISQ